MKRTLFVVGIVIYIALLYFGMKQYMDGNLLEAIVNYALAAAIRPDYPNE